MTNRSDIPPVNLTRYWGVGDFCKCEYAGIGAGIVYKIVRINDDAYAPLLEIEPVIGVLVDVVDKKRRTIAAAWCTLLTVEDLVSFHSKFGHFLLEQIKA